MAKKSIGEEFLELAIEIEKNGRNFYSSIAGKSQDKEVKRVFAQLAEREKEHEEEETDKEEEEREEDEEEDRDKNLDDYK